MNKQIRILLQTTIPTTEDDWSIERFSLLRDYLAEIKDDRDNPLFQVTARNRELNAAGDDPILSALGDSDFDELWLFAVDVGDGLTDKDKAGIEAFYNRGGGILATRDHQDLGSSICNLRGVGVAHFFQTKNPDPDVSRHCIDDIYTTYISWPNYHSGNNGNYQKIEPIAPLHPLLKRPSGGAIEFFPAHPHEGAVGVPPGDELGRAIATGKSLVTDRTFNLAVAFDRYQDDAGNLVGRSVAQSTFHHFCDYNWDVGMGCPSFVDEPPGNTMQTEPQALADIKTYVRNLALWLAPTTVDS
ncbi:MAG: hypothetical protein MUE44_06405 [Oscillatoriaceae cyanobacterium Prado104]|jgi:hypothetical protein|nr:hypothetical protein [Oscillatoriaceae cyanobacterium Prado104]